MNINKLFKAGYYISTLSIIGILLWLGIFKFTMNEAEGIKVLVENHFLMGWLYHVFSVQGVSNLIGIAEIFVGLGMLIGLKYAKVGIYFGALASIIFLTTVSFIFTTPGVWKIIEGIPHINFFLYKDLTLLGGAVMFLGLSYARYKNEAITII